MPSRKPSRRPQGTPSAFKPQPRSASLTLVRTLRRVVADVRQQDSPTVNRLHQVLSALKVAAVVTDDHSRIVITNAVASTLTGYSERELRRLSVYDITGEGDADTVDVLWRAFVQQRRQSGRYEIRTKDEGLILADYVAIANVVPGLHLALLRRVPRPSRGQ